MLEGMDRPRIHGCPHQARPAGADGRRHPLPLAGPVDQGGDDARRAVGGRAWLGIGAAWNEEESRGLGFPFPPLGERFEMLEDTLRMAHQMWSRASAAPGAFDGRHVPGRRLLNSPQVAVAPARPDHDRRRRRAEDPAARRPIRRRLQRLRRAGQRSPTSTRSSPSTVRPSAATPTRSNDRRSRTSALTPTAPAHTETPSEIVDRFGELADAGSAAHHLQRPWRRGPGPARADRPRRDPPASACERRDCG